MGWCAILDLDAAYVNCGGKQQLKRVHPGGLLFPVLSSTSPDAVEGLRTPLLLMTLMKGRLVCYGRSQIMRALTMNKGGFVSGRAGERDNGLNWTVWI